jgi:hypothetical protein
MRENKEGDEERNYRYKQEAHISSNKLSKLTSPSNSTINELATPMHKHNFQVGRSKELTDTAIVTLERRFPLPRSRRARQPRWNPHLLPSRHYMYFLGLFRMAGIISVSSGKKA